MASLWRKKLTVLCLAVYWPTLFILGHIPIPQVVRQADMSDKTLHFLAYFILVFLLWGSMRPYERVDWRRATVWIILTVVVWYGAIDEWLQSYFGRTPDIRDFAADLLGAGTSLVLLTLLPFWPSALLLTGLAVFALANVCRADVTKLLPLTHTAFHVLAYGVFAGLWAVYIQRICRHFARPRTGGLEHWLGKSRPPGQGVLLYLAAPLLLLVTVKLGAVVLQRPFTKSDVVAAAISIVLVSGLAQFLDPGKTRPAA